MNDTQITPTAEQVDAIATAANSCTSKRGVVDWSAFAAMLLCDRFLFAPAEGHNNPPSPIDPEKLIDPDALPALLEENYPALIERGKELQAAIERWKGLFLLPRPEGWPAGKAWPEQYALPDDAANNKTSDFLRQLGSFAGGPLDSQSRPPARGEVNEAREKVKRAPFDACRVIDGWFNGLRADICAAASVMDRAQTVYLRKKVEDERIERERLAAVEAERARQAAEEAKASGGDEEKVVEAIRAEETADNAARAAQAPRADLARSTSAAGTTTGLRSNWTVEVVDLAALIKAVAEGKAPSNFLMENMSVMKATVKAEKGARQYPGLRVIDDAKASRTGRTA